ncbi:MAG: zinc ribbon domain-containing protein, partial [Candidatus ainarchaeum sp.]|nr:zinc ribbon domain-containing protein [Candidatus ainarchaeum sp.]
MATGGLLMVQLPPLPLPYGLGWSHVCCCTVIVLLVIALIIVVFFKRKKEFEPYGEFGMGSEVGGAGLLGYKHPCRYCGKLVPQGSKACPFCGKVSPLGPLRCPRCRNPVQKGDKACGACGLGLEIACPYCGKPTFFGDYCDNCGARLMVVCMK